MLAAAALCGLDAQESEPAVFTYGGMEFTVTGEATAGLSDANKLPEVVIPETVENEGNTYTVTSILEDAFDYNDVTTKVVMPNTITEVAYCGMYGAEAVTELVVSENLRTLGGYAFAYMESLPSIDLPEGITEIPGDCFFMSSALQAIKLPSTVQSIGGGCFYKSGLAEFTFPDACETVGSNVFQGCPNLVKVTFGPNLRTMDEGTFRECAALAEVDMTPAAQLEALPDFLFDQCTALEGTVTIPAGVKSLGIGVFGATNVSGFELAEGNTGLALVDGILYSADKTLLYAFPPKSAATEVTVADGCVGISGGAFDGAASLAKVTLPETMRAFDDNAFLNCSSLKDMNFPASLVYMGSYALAGSGLEEIVLPEGMTTIYEGVMAQMPALKKVTIPAGITVIDMYAFRECEALTDVYCLGAEPATLNWYDAWDHPFYMINSAAVLHVPAGAKAAYESDYDWSDSFAEIVDDQPAVFQPESFDPADGTEMKEFSKVLITFSEEVTIVETQPEAKLYKGDELTGTLMEPDSYWLATEEDDPNTVGIVGQDYDSFNQVFALEAGEEYTFVIPAGTFKSASGALNQKIVLHYAGYTPVSFTYETATPADGSELESLGTVEVEFGQAVTSIDPNPDIVLRKGDAQAGEVITPEWGWNVYTGSDYVNVFPWDEYMEGVQPIELEMGADYYLVIPASIVKNANGDENAEIVLHYVGSNDNRIDEVADACTVSAAAGNIEVRLGSLAGCDVRLYDVAGRMLQAVEGAEGNIVFHTDVKGILFVNVCAEGAIHTFKVVNK